MRRTELTMLRTRPSIIRPVTTRALPPASIREAPTNRPELRPTTLETDEARHRRSAGVRGDALCTGRDRCDTPTGVDRALSRIAIRLFGSTVDSVCGERLTGKRRYEPHGFRRPAAITGRRRYCTPPSPPSPARFSESTRSGASSFSSRSIPTRCGRRFPDPLGFLAAMGGLPSLSLVELVVLFCGSALTLGAVAGYAAYWFRWWYPGYVADARARRIEAGLPALVAFIYALSRSGMAFRWSSASSPISKTPTARPPRSFRLRSGAWTRSAPTSSPPSRRWGGARPARSSASSARTRQRPPERAGTLVVVPRATVSGLPRGTPNPSRRALSICSGRWPKPMSRCWSRGRSF